MGKRQKVGKSLVLWLCQAASILLLVGFFGFLLLSMTDFDELKARDEQKNEGETRGALAAEASGDPREDLCFKDCFTESDGSVSL